MKVLISSSKNRTLLAPIYFDYAKVLGFSVFETFYHDSFVDFYNRSLINKIFFKFNSKIAYKASNVQLLNDVEEYAPDILFVFKGMEIFPNTLKLIKQKGVKLVNYNLDHPFFFNSRGSGNSNVLNSLSLFDYHFTYSMYIKNQFLNYYKISNVKYLPFGFDERINSKIRSEEEINKVCFIGHADYDRYCFIREIVKLGFDVDLYGISWNKYFKRSEFNNLNLYFGVSGSDYYKLLKKYRVQLNIMRPQNVFSHNMRSFEIPSVGGIMLVEETPEHNFFFESGLDCFFYKDKKDLISSLREIFNLPTTAIREIRENAYLNSINKEYSYKYRVLDAFNFLNKL